MRRFSAKCIILGHKDLSENDKFVFLYNEEMGKIKAVAKGARKITSKFTGHLETLNICTAEFYISPRNILITEISTDENFRNVRENLETLSGALQIAEITDKLLYENQKLENLIKLIQKTISHLSKTKKPLLISMAYMIKLLDKIGIIPDFKAIENEFNLEQKYRKFFEYLKTKTLTEIEKIHLTKEETSNIKNFLNRIIEEETGKTFKSFLI
ncbi:MAG: DNA repair protein RecO [Candidatus Gracilibacteria bacterium]|nr:DNA repair protein RecO [Candidatus Gracilibacteria bacterium]